MRIIVIKQASDLQALSGKILGKKAAGSATLERVKALNPHVNFERIEAGTVLFLPDAPDLKSGDKDSKELGGDAFDDFVRDIADGFDSAAARTKSAAAGLSAERGAVTDVLKLATVKRLLESDAALKKQLDEAADEFATEQKELQTAAKQLEALQKIASDELAALAPLLR